MYKPEISVIIPCHNEATMVGRCISTVLEGLVHAEGVQQPEVIVVASASTDGSREVAQDILANQQDVSSNVICVRKRGKKLALNAGLAVASGEIVVCVDADTYVAQGAISRAYNDLQTPGTRLVSGQYAPLVADDWVNKKPAPSIELLRACRRQITQPHRSVVGRFIGYYRKDMKDGYAAGPAPDDLWLSAKMGSRFGLDSIVVNSEQAVTYVPPQNLRDLYEQTFRYRSARHLVEKNHPELNGYFEELTSHWRAIDGEDSGQRWRAEANKLGLDFDRWELRNADIIHHVDRAISLGRSFGGSKRVDFWTPQSSTKRSNLMPVGARANA